MHTVAKSIVLASLVLSPTAGAVRFQRRGENHQMPYDPMTTPYCTWWWDNEGLLSCAEVAGMWAIPPEDFLRWNPSLTDACGNFQQGQSYCVEAAGEPKPGTPVTTSTRPEPTEPENGIETSLPMQPGMVDNCDSFYFVKQGEGCEQISSQHGISPQQFYSWNPEVGSSCAGLFTEVYVCVSIIGHTPTPTGPGNGITTPTPTQPGMVNNCDAFHFVEAEEDCATIAAKNGISPQEFFSWNPEVRSNCSGLWAEVYVCVSIIGHMPTPTDPGNGVSTPSPIQSGMTTNCRTFHLVRQGQGCAVIATQYSISVTDFVKWNPAAKSDCSGLWADTYACVAVL